MRSLPVTMSGRLKSAMSKGATSCAAKFTALTGIASYAMRFARSATVVEHLEEITGYATAIGFLAHAVARTNQDLKALIGAATEFPGPGFLLPTRNHEVFEWCLSCELKLVFQMTLMTTGLYNEPAGAYLPSILY